MCDRFQIGSGDVILITGGIKYIPEGQGGLQIRAKPLLRIARLTNQKESERPCVVTEGPNKVSIQLNTGYFCKYGEDYSR